MTNVVDLLTAQNESENEEGERFGLYEIEGLEPGYVCKAFWRHGAFSGGVYVRRINEVTYWVAVLECKCGTWRTTKYTPNTGQRVGGHRYWRSKRTAYPTDLSQEECMARVLAAMLVKERTDNGSGEN
jgi:hypothetical protein